MRHRRWIRSRSFWGYSAGEEYEGIDEAGFFAELSLIVFRGDGR